uniref:Uncharacterized protein n=1 Tax=viral metagenome TaxID=1070528 RepID=A0A6C0K2S7_9ZZZZ
MGHYTYIYTCIFKHFLLFIQYYLYKTKIHINIYTESTTYIYNDENS